MRYSPFLAATLIATFAGMASSSAAPRLKSGYFRETPSHNILGNIYGVCNAFDGMTSDIESYADAFWGKIDFSDLSAKAIYLGLDFCNYLDQEHQTGAVRDGILYIPEGRRSNVRDFDLVWKRIDINSGKVLTPIECPPDITYWLQTMCYDPVTDAFYGMTGKDDGQNTTYNRIVKITLTPEETLKAEVLTDLPSSPGAILCGFFYNCADEEIYSLRDNGTIVNVDRNTGRATLSAELFCDDYEEENVIFSTFEERGTSYITYSPKDDTLIMVARDNYSNGNPVKVYTIDPNDGQVTLLGKMAGGAMMTTLCCTDRYAQPDAPAEVVVNNISFSGAALSGSVTILAPATLYDASPLKKDVTVSISIDGKMIASSQCAPGAEVTFPINTTEGLHSLEALAYIKESNPGPASTLKFYAGYDNPDSPSALAIDGNTLTWTAPSAVGQHGGYVDTSRITYDVYFNQLKQNTSPLTSTSFSFTPPSSQALTSITVTASTQGKTSLPSAPLNAVIGNALSLPYSFDGSAEEASLFTTFGKNDFDTPFVFSQDTGEFTNSYENYEGSDAWLVLPLISFPSAGSMYELTADFRNFTPFYGSENIFIHIGRKADAASLSRQIFRYEEMAVGDDVKSLPIKVRFNIEEAGDYYIAFHTLTPESGSGSRLKGLRVKRLNDTTEAPAAPSDLSMKASAKGELMAEFDMTLPLTSLSGKRLSASDRITVSAATLQPGISLNASATGLPGEKITLRCPAVNGFNHYSISLANSAGEGCGIYQRGYVGIDIPCPVTGLKATTSADNMTMRLDWNEVTEGINGGYIDPENMRYQVWYNPSGVTWQRVGDGIKELSAIFNPGYDQMYRWRLTVMPENSAGFKKTYTVNYVEDFLGRPYTLPVVEPFGMAGVAYPWNYNTNTAATENSYARQILNDEVPLLKIGDARFDDGSGRLVATYFPGEGKAAEVMVPKFSTAGMSAPAFSMKIWNYPLMPSIKVMARKYGQEQPVEIASYSFDRNNPQSWREIILPLPQEYVGEQWVQLRLRFDFMPAENSYALIDGIDIYEAVDHDFKLQSLTSEAVSHVGESASFDITTINAGQTDGAAIVKVEVKGDDRHILHTTQYSINRLRSLRQHLAKVDLEAKAEYLNYKTITVVATVMHENDAIAANDSRSIEWDIIPPVNPVVTDLKGEITEKGASLSWSEPDYGYGSFDDFEYLKPFDHGDVLGQWGNYDADGYFPFGIDGLTDRWPDFDKPRAWQVVSASALGVETDPRLKAHSGDKYLCAMSGWDESNPEAQVQVADWLISPEVIGGTEVKFWLNNISTLYQETLHVMVSSTDNRPESFKKLRNISKKGDESWEQTAFLLPPDTKYFALVYVGWNNLGIVIDDIEFSPVKEEKWTIDSYDIYRSPIDSDSFTKIANVAAPSFIDAEFDGESKYYILTNATLFNEKSVGPKSNIVTLSVSGVDEVTSIGGVEALRGCIVISGHNGEYASISTADGKTILRSRLDSDRVSIPLHPGIYIVGINGISAKVMVR